MRLEDGHRGPLAEGGRKIDVEERQDALGVVAPAAEKHRTFQARGPQAFFEMLAQWALPDDAKPALRPLAHELARSRRS